MFVGVALILCSLIYSILILGVYFFKKRVNTQETKIYNALLIVNFINLILELLCCYTVYNMDKMPFFTEIINRLFLIVIFYWQTLFTLYNYMISFKTRNNDKLNFNTKLGKFFIIVIIFMFLGLLMLPLEYYNQNDVVYSYGKAANFLYFIVVLYFISWIVMYIKKYNVKEKRKYLPLLSFIVIMGIALVVRAINPGILVISSSFAFVTNLMFFTIENPDMKLLEELHKSKEISDSANEEKTMFLYNMTQDIRNTTNEIDGNVNMILDSDNVDEIHDYARDIKVVTSRFNSMTNDILDISKLDDSNIKIYNNKYSIKTIIKEFITMYGNICKNRNIDFRSNIDHDIPDTLYGDSISLKEAISIILDNSSSNTKDGYIEFDVNAIIKNNVCRLIITIEDSGTGIKSDELEKVKVKGKSLGRANKLVTLMGGTMMLSSNYGYGTKVKIIIDQRIEVMNNDTVTKYSDVFDDISLLMVDDSEAGIKIIDKLLKGSNIKFDSVANGKDCLDLVKIKKYDIILIDEELSQITGAELLKKIKAIRNFKTPVILLTKDNNYEYNEEYKKLGFDDYILKPVKKDILLDKINGCLKKDK